MSATSAFASLNEMTSTVVAAYVRNHNIAARDVPAVIMAVRNALASVGTEVVPETVELVPAVPIRKSITPEYLICLEDGRKMKMLKQHLRRIYHLTPDAYRQKWSLPPEYPMTAPNYAKQRSDLAKDSGLGRSPHARR